MSIEKKSSAPPLWSDADNKELERFKRYVTNTERASRVERTDPAFNKEFKTYMVHLWSPPPSFADTAQATYNFISLDAAKAAVNHAEQILKK